VSESFGAARPHDGIVREAIVLAGGEATRLGAIAAAIPKCLQPVAGRPFLDYLLRELRRHGVRRIVLATGRLHEAVERHVGGGTAFGLEVVYSLEPEPLGTAGAVALAARELTGEAAYVCNGDSLLDCNLVALGRALHEAPQAEVAVALHRVEDTARYGVVTAGDDGVVTGFAEKTNGGAGLVNGGMYCARTAWLKDLEVRFSSLESDVFPALVTCGGMVSVATGGLFIDI
jgi:NDP-sugar pyrophosphorylase family protein